MVRQMNKQNDTCSSYSGNHLKGEVGDMKMLSKQAQDRSTDSIIQYRRKKL